MLFHSLFLVGWYFYGFASFNGFADIFAVVVFYGDDHIKVAVISYFDNLWLFALGVFAEMFAHFCKLLYFIFTKHHDRICPAVEVIEVGFGFCERFLCLVPLQLLGCFFKCVHASDKWVIDQSDML